MTQKRPKKFVATPHKPEESLRFVQAKEKFSDWSQSAFSDSLFWIFLSSWFLPLLICVAYLAINFSSLPAEIPLFYSRVWGGQQLAKTEFIFFPAAGAFLLGIFDFSMAINFHSRDRVFAYLFCGSAALLAMLVLVTSLNIVNLVK